ncbi:hypothetical protein BDZ89DRAFT_1044553 [Hymenopellis radicata]|nr:hypothetical protein BDZ89DRAFT_1044553 [Hymenopellis radicata]
MTFIYLKRAFSKEAMSNSNENTILNANRTCENAETQLLDVTADVQKTIKTVQTVIGNSATEILKDLLILMEIQSKKGQEKRALKEVSRVKANIDKSYACSTTPETKRIFFTHYRDVFCIEATGGGKSALFSVPIIVYNEVSKNPTLYPRFVC